MFYYIIVSKQTNKRYIMSASATPLIHSTMGASSPNQASNGASSTAEPLCTPAVRNCAKMTLGGACCVSALGTIVAMPYTAPFIPAVVSKIAAITQAILGAGFCGHVVCCSNNTD